MVSWGEFGKLGELFSWGVIWSDLVQLGWVQVISPHHSDRISDRILDRISYRISDQIGFILMHIWDKQCDSMQKVNGKAQKFMVSWGEFGKLGWVVQLRGNLEWLGSFGGSSGHVYSSLLSHVDRTQVYLGSDLWVQVSLTHSLSHWCLVDLTYVSLVDEDANLILADDTNRAIPGNLKMQVAPPGDQI